MNRHRTDLFIALAAVSLTLVAAACGSMAKSSSAAASGDPPLNEAQCMRSHGAPNFPDPSPGGPSVIPKLDQPAGPRVSVRTEGLRQVPEWRWQPRV